MIFCFCQSDLGFLYVQFIQSFLKMKGYFHLRGQCGNAIMTPKGGVFMKDFPLFSTEAGVSSLILKEIPYRQEAYIHIQDLQPGGLSEHLNECVSFCRMAGAERIFATGHEALEGYPVHMSLLEMRGVAWVDTDLLRNLFPVTEQTVSQWRQIYNEAMRKVDNAQTLEKRDEEKILSSGGAYFIHDNGTLLGIGWMEDTKLLAVASVVPGAGQQLMHTLMSLVEGADMTIEVASTNHKAIRLYEKLGFLQLCEVKKWYIVP